MRSVSLRVRGYDEETEQLSEDLVGVTGKVADLTKAASNNGRGISLFTDESQTQYKDLVVYFGEIADVMDEISQKDKQELLELLFGKHRANAGAALLTNYDQVYNVIDTIKNSAGSAEREINTMKESLDYSINAFKESWTEIGQTAIDRGGLKTIVDFGTSILNILNDIIKNLGVVPTLIGAIVGSTMAFKNVGELLNTPVSILPHIISIENVTRFKIRLSNCWDDYAKAL